LANEVYQWSADDHGAIAYAAHVGGLVAGALYAWLLRPRDERTLHSRISGQFPDEQARNATSLLDEARAAAARMDIKRATRLYRELIEQDTQRTDWLLAYFNIAMLGHDEEALRDGCLRLLWMKERGPREEMRRAYVQMALPKVARVLPVDEQLRLARRLVKAREDATALRVLDALIADAHTRELYGRQIADCLLGLFTSYNRNGLKAPAEAIRERLIHNFGSAEAIGGLAPERAPPVTIRATRTSTVNLDLDLRRGPDGRR